MINYTIKKNENIDYLQFNKLLEFQDKLVHGIFLKNHNVGFHLKNDPEIREESVNKVCKEFKIDRSKIIQARQMHTDIVQKVDNCTENIIDGVDGFCTNRKNIATIITFADCMPVMIYDPVNNVYANIHSGWKGVCNKIALKGIEKIKENYDCKTNNLIVCIGPNISKESFLVNDDVVKIYNNIFGVYINKYPIISETEYINKKGKQYKIDNNLLMELMLKDVGVLEKNIFNCDICTVLDSKEFHSRRAEGPMFENNGNIMMLR